MWMVELPNPAESDKHLSVFQSQPFLKDWSCDYDTRAADMLQIAVFKSTSFYSVTPPSFPPTVDRPVTHEGMDDWPITGQGVCGVISGPFTAWTRAISHGLTRSTVLRERIIQSPFQYYSARREDLWPWRWNAAKSADAEVILAFCSDTPTRLQTAHYKYVNGLMTYNHHFSCGATNNIYNCIL